MESSKVYSSCWKFLLCVVVITVSVEIKFGGAEVQRLYPSGNSTNRSHACAGSDEVILTCHGRGSNITWIATSDSVDIGRIIFFSSDAEGMIISQGIIRGFLIDVDNNNNLVSELRVHTTPSMRPISIACSSQVGRSTHLIAPAAIPDQPNLLGPRQLQQMGSSTTSILYHLQWEAPSNSDDIDLDHYQIYENDILVQRIHADQTYALVSLQVGITATIKVAAANRCGQISNYSFVTITPERPQTTTVAASDVYATTSSNARTDTSIDDQTSGSHMSVGSLITLVCATFLALLTQA